MMEWNSHTRLTTKHRIYICITVLASQPASRRATSSIAGRRFGWLICSSFSSLLERTCSPPFLRVLHQSFSFFLSLVFPLSTAMIRTRRALKRWPPQYVCRRAAGVVSENRAKGPSSARCAHVSNSIFRKRRGTKVARLDSYNATFYTSY